MVGRCGPGGWAGGSGLRDAGSTTSRQGDATIWRRERFRGALAPLPLDPGERRRWWRSTARRSRLHCLELFSEREVAVPRTRARRPGFHSGCGGPPPSTGSAASGGWRCGPRVWPASSPSSTGIPTGSPPAVTTFATAREAFGEDRPVRLSKSGEPVPPPGLKRARSWASTMALRSRSRPDAPSTS